VQLTNRVVLVTHAASELGRSIAALCAELGASVVLTDTNPAAGAEIVTWIESAGHAATFVDVDHNQEESLQSAVGEAILNFGSLTGVVLCPPSSAPGDALACTIEEWERDVGAETRAAWMLVRAALPFLKEARCGSIVAVAGGERRGRRAFRDTVREAAVTAMIRSWAADFGPHGVRANALVAGSLETAELKRAVGAEPEAASRLARIKTVVPLGRMGRPEEIAQAAVFLMSDAASYVSGATLRVDGGQCAAGEAAEA
jgi:NAD(P)-dependent dehydrogenase (short-subunit alcohol dehydrogenase family)